MSRPIVTLTTDFGLDSPYVAQMKGVLLSNGRDPQLVDITHLVPPQSIRHAEVMLRAAAFAFPLGTVHLVVVDPGVGTPRRAIAVEARGMRFVGPDNGVLGLALAEPGARAVVLDHAEIFLHPVSATFHGRDVFAPVAAELADGAALTEVGTLIDDARPTTLPAPRVEAGEVHGEVLIADSFGNLLTNIPAALAAAVTHIEIAGHPAERVRTFGDGPRGTLLVIEGSEGFLELAIRDGSAASLFGGAHQGLEVRCRTSATASMS